jgi:hypothetical protein
LRCKLAERSRDVLSALLRQFAPSVRPPHGSAETATVVKDILVVWYVLLVADLPWFGLGVMVLYGGGAWRTHPFFLCALIYPVSVGIAYRCRQRMPPLVLLPLVDVVLLAMLFPRGVAWP